MKTTLIIVWIVLAIVCGIIFRLVARFRKRKMSRGGAIQKLITLLLCLLAGGLLMIGLGSSPHFIWAGRIALLAIGIGHVWGLRWHAWVLRDKFFFKRDSFLMEFLYTAILAFGGSVAFALPMRLLRMLRIGAEEGHQFWDSPILLLLPFLIVKLSDLYSQIPFRVVENPWFFPVEPVAPETWNWRDIMQCNFQVSNSLRKEYRLFSSPAHPWIEAPRESSLGSVFRLLIQERRKNKKLSTIQDMGDEYTGQPQFWWLFSIKRIWWNPLTWFRSPRYLNPDYSLTQNKVRKWDVVKVRRIPAEGTIYTGSGKEPQAGDIDPEKTVLINKD